MKLYKHSNGKTHFFPEVIPKGWEVMLNQGSASFKYGNFIQVSGNGVSNTNYGSYLNIS